MLFFYKQHFYKQRQAKQHPEAKLLLFEIVNILHPRYYPTKYIYILKSKLRNMYVCIHGITQLTILKMKMKNRLHRYNINRPMSRHWHKYSKCKKGYSMKMFYVLSNA